MAWSSSGDLSNPWTGSVGFETCLSTLKTLHRHAVLAEMLKVPTHLLASRLMEQTNSRLLHVRWRSQRSAIYRTDKPASATSALTAWVIQRQLVSQQRELILRDTPSESSLHSDSSDEDDSVNSAVFTAVTSRTSPRARHGETSPVHSAQKAATALVLAPVEVRPSNGAAAAPQQLLLEQPAAATVRAGNLPVWPDAGIGQSDSPTECPVGIGAPGCRSGSFPWVPVSPWPEPHWRSNLTATSETWTRLGGANTTAIKVYDTAKAYIESPSHGDSNQPDGVANGFRAKLRHKTALELQMTVKVALEELREAVSYLPAHRMAWCLSHLEAEVAAPGTHHGDSDAEDRTELRSAAREEHIRRGFDLLLAHALLTKSYPRSAHGPIEVTGASGYRTSKARYGRVNGHGTYGCGGGGEDGSDGGGSCTGPDDMHEQRRGHHERCAVLIMDALSAAYDLPTLSYPELVALTHVGAETWMHSRLEGPPNAIPATSSAAPLPKGSCAMNLRQAAWLARQCTATVAAALRTHARGWSAAHDAARKPVSTAVDQQRHVRQPYRERLEECIQQLEELTFLEASKRLLAAQSHGQEEHCAASGEGRSGRLADDAHGKILSMPYMGKLLHVSPRLVEYDKCTASRNSVEGGSGLFLQVCSSGRRVRLPATSRGGGGADDESCLVLGLDYAHALGLLPSSGSCAGGYCASAGPGCAGVVADNTRTAADRSAAVAVMVQMELAGQVLGAALAEHPRRLFVSGPAALRRLVITTALVGWLRQTSLPHPAALTASALAEAGTPASGPLLLRIELACQVSPPEGQVPEPREAAGGHYRLCAMAAAATEELSAGEGVGAMAGQQEDFMGQVVVTVVPRSAAVGESCRRLLRRAREGGQPGQPARNFPMVIPSGGYSSHPSSSGVGEGGGLAGLSDDKRLLHSKLATHGWAWLQCPDREALQAAALLVAKVHHELILEHEQDWQKEQQQQRRRKEEKQEERAGQLQRDAPQANAAAGTLTSLAVGLEVLPCLGARWSEQLGEAACRIKEDLPLAVQPLMAASGMSAAGDGGMLEGGWQSVWRLALNREVCRLIRLMDVLSGSSPLVGRGGLPPTAASTDGAGGGSSSRSSSAGGSGTAAGSTYKAGAFSECPLRPQPWGRSCAPEGVRLLVLRHGKDGTILGARKS